MLVGWVGLEAGYVGWLGGVGGGVYWFRPLRAASLAVGESRLRLVNQKCMTRSFALTSMCVMTSFRRNVYVGIYLWTIGTKNLVPSEERVEAASDRR